MSSKRIVYGFTVEQNVPIPPVAARQGHNIALLKALQPGESIYFDAPIAKRATRFYRVAKKLNIQVMIRKDQGGMRLWRLPDDMVMHQPPRAAKPAKAKVVAKVNGKKHGKVRSVFPTEKAHTKRPKKKVAA